MDGGREGGESKEGGGGGGGDLEVQCVYVYLKRACSLSGGRGGGGGGGEGAWPPVRELVQATIHIFHRLTSLKKI